MDSNATEHYQSNLALRERKEVQMGAPLRRASLLAVFCASVVVSREAAPEDGSFTGRVRPLPEILAAIGDAHSLHFCVEEAWKAGEPAEPILARSLHLKGHDVSTADKAIEALRATLPDTVIRQSKSTPAIVHVIDKRLIGLGKYPLDRTLPDLKFQGSPAALIGRIAREVEGLAENPSIPIVGGRLEQDFVTPLKFRAKGATVRQILSDHIPLREYSRVIWVAKTTLADPILTEVCYKGKRRRRTMDSAEVAPQDNIRNLIGEALAAYAKVSAEFADGSYDKALPRMARNGVPCIPGNLADDTREVTRYVKLFKNETRTSDIEALVNMVKAWKVMGGKLGPAEVEVVHTSKFVELERGASEYAPIAQRSVFVVRVPCLGSEPIGQRYFATPLPPQCRSMTQHRGLVVMMIKIGDSWFWQPFGW